MHMLLLVTAQRHDSSSALLCLYCLKTFKTHFFKNVGYSATSHYYQHLQKHLAKGVSQNCHCCKLTFHSKSEMSQHVLKDHAPNFRGVLGINIYFECPRYIFIILLDFILFSKIHLYIASFSTLCIETTSTLYRYITDFFIYSLQY